MKGMKFLFCLLTAILATFSLLTVKPRPTHRIIQYLGIFGMVLKIRAGNQQPNKIG